MLKVGDRVTWHFAPSDGYRETIPVPGVVRKLNRKRVTIEIAYRSHGEWCRDRKAVDPSNLSPREAPAAELGEEIE